MLYIAIGVSFGLGSTSRRPSPALILFFFLYQILNLAALVIHLSSGTLGDIFLPVGVQLAVRKTSTIDYDVH